MSFFADGRPDPTQGRMRGGGFATNGQYVLLFMKRYLAFIGIITMVKPIISKMQIEDVKCKFLFSQNKLATSLYLFFFVHDVCECTSCKYYCRGKPKKGRTGPRDGRKFRISNDLDLDDEDDPDSGLR